MGNHNMGKMVKTTVANFVQKDSEKLMNLIKPRKPQEILETLLPEIFGLNTDAIDNC